MGRQGTLTVKVEGLSVLADIRDQFLFAPKSIEKATDRALNHALNAIRAEGVRVARGKYTAKAKDVRAAIKIRRVSVNNARGEVFFDGRVGTPAASFQISPRRAPRWKGVAPRNRKPVEGILARYLKEGSSSPVKGPQGQKSFLAPYGGGVYAWYRRSRHEGLRMLFGPSPIQALTALDSRDRLAEHGLEDFRKQLSNQVKQLFRKGVA